MLQRRWQVAQPQIYDRQTRIVCLDIVKEDGREGSDEDSPMVEGYSFIPVEIDSQIDYGHIKSQLIEAGFAQKDEFGLLMNAVEAIVDGLSEGESWQEFKAGVLGNEDVRSFAEFCQFRQMCADAAKEVLRAY